MFTRSVVALAFVLMACGASGCCNGCCGTGFGQPAYGAAPTSNFGNYAYAPAPGATGAPAHIAPPVQPQPATVASQPQAVRY